MIRSTNPATGELLQHFQAESDAQIEAKLQRAGKAFEQNCEAPFSERAGWMNRAAHLLEREKADLGRMMTLEMGKPIRAAVQEAEKCAWACRYYAEHGAGFMQDQEIVAEDGLRIRLKFQPLGPVLAIMPWNFPFWQVFRFAVPALMAGNVGLLKHASNVPRCAIAIEDLLGRAGFPEGSFQTLLIGSEGVNEIIADPRVAAVTLTGSVAAGRSVAAEAGKHLKKTVLELGGSDPFIVMPSCDLEAAVETAVQARIINNGQSCIAAKRFIVDSRIAVDFERRFVERMSALRVGDPLDEQTEVGPLATEKVLTDLADQVKRSIDLGARLLLGGQRLDRPGYFYAPTVLTHILPGTPAHDDELFGPVACLFTCDGIEEAVRLANDSQFGLGACVWTNDARERDYFIDHVEAGLAFVNSMVASDPRAPFGGVKHSGYGRELGPWGMREFLNHKTVSIRQTTPAQG